MSRNCRLAGWWRQRLLADVPIALQMPRMASGATSAERRTIAQRGASRWIVLAIDRLVATVTVSCHRQAARLIEGGSCNRAVFKRWPNWMALLSNCVGPGLKIRAGFAVSHRIHVYMIRDSFARIHTSFTYIPAHVQCPV